MTDTPQNPAASAPPPDHRAPSGPVTSELAANLRHALAVKKITDPQDLLHKQALLLDTLFSHLLLKDAGKNTTGMDTAFGLALALRAQKQCRSTIDTIENLKHEAQRAADARWK